MYVSQFFRCIWAVTGLRQTRALRVIRVFVSTLGLGQTLLFLVVQSVLHWIPVGTLKTTMDS